MDFMIGFCRKGCENGAEPDLSRNRIDDIVRGVTGMEPIFDKARELCRVPTPEEAFPLSDYETFHHIRLGSERIKCPLNFRAGDRVSDVRRLVRAVVKQAPVKYRALGLRETVLLTSLAEDSSDASETLSLTRGYEEAVRLSRPNASDVSGRQSRLVEAVRGSIPSDGLFASVRWALQWHFPHRVSKEDIRKWELRVDDTPESIRRALDEILGMKPEIANIINRPFDSTVGYEFSV